MRLSNITQYNCTHVGLHSVDHAYIKNTLYSLYSSTVNNTYTLTYSVKTKASCSQHIIRESLQFEPSTQVHPLNDTHLQLAWTENHRSIRGRAINLETPLQSVDNVNIELPKNYFKLRVSGPYPETLFAAYSSLSHQIIYKPFQTPNSTIINARAIQTLDSVVLPSKTIITWTNIFPDNSRALSVQALNQENSKITDAIKVNTELSSVPLYPSITYANDIAAIAWQGHSASNGKESIFLRMIDTNLNFTTSEIPVTYTSEGSQSYATTTSHKNLFALGWIDSGTSNNDKWAQGKIYFTNGTNATQIFTLNDKPYISDVKVYSDENNKFTFVWTQKSGQDAHLFSRTVDVSEYVVEHKENLATQTHTVTEKRSLSHTKQTPTPSLTATTIPETTTKTDIDNHLTNSTTTSPSQTRSLTQTASETVVQTESNPYIPMPISVTQKLPNSINNQTSPEKETKTVQTKPTSIPVQAQIASHATASAVAATSVSPVTAGIAIRSNALTAVMSCEEHFYRNNTFTLSDNLTPSFGFLIGDTEDEDAYSNLLYSSALLTGSFALIGAVAYFAPPALIGIKVIASIAAHFPGNYLPLSMFLSATAITSSITILKFQQNRGSFKAVMAQGGAGLALASNVAQLGYYTHKAVTIKKHADFEDNKWIAHEGEEKYVKMNRVAFQDYREGREWFVAVDLGMNIATSALPGWKPDVLSKCSTTKHTATALYAAYTIAQLALQPHAETYHKVANSLANTLILTTAILNSAQEIKPELKNSTITNDIMNIAPMVATGIATTVGLFDLVKTGKKLYDKPLPTQPVDPSQGKLVVPQPQKTHHAVTTVNDNDHTAVQMNPLTQKLLAGHNHDQQDAL